MNLLDYMSEQKKETESPLASRLRPTTLDEVVGQKHIIGKDKLLYRAIQADKLSSLIFYGPPGTGKTTLAKVIANTTSAAFLQINAKKKKKKDMEEVVEKAKEAIRNGACIVTDTQMAKSGINKKKLAAYGGEVFCFMSDEDVAETAKKNGTTRATACMDKAAAMNRPLIFAIGNAPTALIRLYELIEEKKLKPELVIGVPVGFVNVVQSKELIMQADVPYIVARGRKGGSNIAACICNALLYNM